LIVGTGALLCIGFFSIAALVVEEEEEQDRLLTVATKVVPPTLLAIRKTQRRSPGGFRFPTVKRRIIFWDRDRAVASIEADYLGPHPNFSLDDFKRIF
jgi:hypothetical protein